MRIPGYNAEFALLGSSREYRTFGVSRSLSVFDGVHSQFVLASGNGCCTPPLGGCCRGHDSDGFPCNCCRRLLQGRIQTICIFE
jgi:hypothetical protein